MSAPQTPPSQPARLMLMADDFTGAGDSGVHFCRSGLDTVLLMEQGALEEVLAAHEVVLLSSESRFMPPAEAAAAVAGLARRCLNAGVKAFYKKVDSTLRGNLGAEIAAALDVLPYAAALVCTAMPKTGRTCVDGRLLIHGTPVHESELGHDPFTPVLSSDVAEIISCQTDLPVGKISLRDLEGGEASLAGAVARELGRHCRILTADARTQEDLQLLGAFLRSCRPPLLPVGAGGLAEAFAAPQGVKAGQGAAKPEGRLLAVIGSLSSTTLQQADLALDMGLFEALHLNVTAGLDDPDAEAARLAAEAAKLDGHLLLRISEAPRPGALNTASGTRIADLYGRIAARLCAALTFDSLYVTGGSTAVAVASRLGLHSVTMREELSPGVVLSSCAGQHPSVRWFVSKAGGFGDPMTLANVVRSMPQREAVVVPC